MKKEIKPFDYQATCISLLKEHRNNGKKRGLVVMASGLGKTYTSAFDIYNFLNEKRGRKFLFLCHQNDILEQAKQTFSNIFDAEKKLGYFFGGTKEVEADGLFASFQSIKNRLEVFEPSEFDYIVVDESHHSMAETYASVIDYFQPKFLLGITATPERTDLQDIRTIYGEEIYSLPLDEALAKNLLTKVDYRVMSDEIQDLSVLETPAGRLSINQLNKRLFIPKRDEEIFASINNHVQKISNPKVMIFCPSIDYCEHLSKLIPGSLTIHSSLRDGEQIRRLKEFKLKSSGVILTVDKFNEGIDVPEVNVIVFLRSTHSLSIFLQQLGRGLRKSPSKEKVLVLDFVANCERIEIIASLRGRINEFRERVVKTVSDEALELDYGKITFTETLVKVIDVIQAVRTGYTKKVLIRQLKDIAIKLDRSPTIEDVNNLSSQGLCASAGTFYRTFGSFNNALYIAELSANLTYWTKDELKNMIRDCAAHLDRSPTLKELRKHMSPGKAPSSRVFRNLFGSYNKAIEYASLEPLFKSRYTKTALKQKLKRLARLIERRPRTKDIALVNKTLPIQERFPSPEAFANAFGSWNEALVQTGFKPLVTLNYDRNLLIKQLSDLKSELGRNPTTREVDKLSAENKMAHTATFRKVFGSWEGALEAIK